ncbi:hypothetical protein BDZ91DRAFT_790756 [Kalaharituber pfeilii]|nr:hypothetical protein BDZ91DRAFT_790756 [Kalaharituber pfeilii]
MELDLIDPALLHSEFFRIYLADAPDAPSQPPPPFQVHRALLASLSTEFANHVNNDMKEGKEGEMLLHDVNYITMQMFLQWVYSRKYRPPKDSSACALGRLSPC